MAVVAGPVRADPADDAVAAGEAFGRQGDWSRAIDAFKSADAHAPRAKHACLIGLAYSRRELWAEAELFFALCEQRATPSDPLPDWLPDAKQQLDAKLTASNASAITFAVEPATADITLSSFAPGETFHARTIHLPAGAHLATVSAPGFATQKLELLVVAGMPKRVAITLERSAPRSKGPWVLWGVAALAGATAIVYDLTAVSSARSALESTYQIDYDQNVGAYERRRTIAIALTGTAVVAAVAGAVWRFVIDRPPPVAIGVEAGHGGGAVTIGWSR